MANELTEVLVSRGQWQSNMESYLGFRRISRNIHGGFDGNIWEHHIYIAGFPAM